MRIAAKRLRMIAALTALAAPLMLAAKPTEPPSGASSRPAAALPDSVAGKLLVAGPGMPDGRFKHSVILMIEHNREGAFGLVVNKPLGIAEFELQSGDGDQPGESGTVHRRAPVFWGGPVEPDKSFILHSADYENEATLKISDGVSLTANPEILHAIAKGNGPKTIMHVLGYAGWAPGQLDSEMRGNDWHTAPASRALIFGEKPGERWQKALDQRFREL